VLQNIKQNLYNNKELSDLVFEVQGEKIYAHKGSLHLIPCSVKCPAGPTSLVRNGRIDLVFFMI
jgi:hypothetical protein